MAADFGDRTAVVTGASRGIGRATVERLAAAGFHVVCVSRGGDELDRVARRCSGTAMVADLSRTADVEALGRGLLDLPAGPPELLVNNAGVFALAPVAELTPGTFDRHMAVNVRAPFLLARALLPAMRERGAGHLVHVGSVAGREPLPENGAYASSKFALRGLHGVLRRELAGSGVVSTLLEPGPVDTGAWDPMAERLGRDLPARETMLRPGQVAGALLAAVRMGPLGEGGSPDVLSLTPA